MQPSAEWSSPGGTAKEAAVVGSPSEGLLEGLSQAPHRVCQSGRAALRLEDRGDERPGFIDKISVARW